MAEFLLHSPFVLLLTFISNSKEVHHTKVQIQQAFKDCSLQFTMLVMAVLSCYFYPLAKGVQKTNFKAYKNLGKRGMLAQLANFLWHLRLTIYRLVFFKPAILWKKETSQKAGRMQA